MAMMLIADTDLDIIDVLPPILSTYMPDIVVEVCTSPEDLQCNVKCWAYDTIAINPILFQHYPLGYKADRHHLVPLLVTASRNDCEVASKYLEGKAVFDLIVKPIIPEEAVQTVCLALWQGALLKLLASKERATERFLAHMEEFPKT